jgi:hypothetical protein
MFALIDFWHSTCNIPSDDLEKVTKGARVNLTDASGSVGADGAGGGKAH